MKYYLLRVAAFIALPLLVAVPNVDRIAGRLSDRDRDARLQRRRLYP